MHTYRLVRFVSVFCLLCLPAAAQTTTSSTTATSDPRAVALIQRSLAALTRGVTISDVTLTGTARRIAGSDDEAGSVTLKATATGNSRIDLNLPSGLRSEVRSSDSSGLSIGSWSNPDGAVHSTPQHNLMTDPSWFFPAFSPARLLAPGSYLLSYIGHETLEGQAVEHVEAYLVAPKLSANAAAVLKQWSQTDIYLGSSTLLPAAIRFDTHPDNTYMIDIHVEIRYSNYQSTGGTAIPLHIEKYINNGLAFDFQVESAVVNSGLSATAFQLQ